MGFFWINFTIRKTILIRVGFSTIFLFPVSSALTQPPFPKQLEVKDIIAFEQLHYYDGVMYRIFADFDLDGIEEYIHIPADRRGILMTDLDQGDFMRPIWHAAATLECGRSKALDFSGDRAPEVFLPLKEGDRTWITIYENIHGSGETGYRPLLATEPVSGEDINGDGVWDGIMEDCQVLDVNGDGQKDILAVINTPYDINPRGVMAFDGFTGRNLWKFLTAGSPGHLVCRDVNNDGEVEIIFDTWAPSNGNEINGMDDYHSYLFCLNNKGKLVWRDEMGGVFTGTQYILGDINGDGEVEIVCTYATGDRADKSTKHELQIRKAKTGKVEKYRRLPTEFCDPFLTDLDRDTKLDIIVANRNRTLSVFDSGLNLKNQVLLPERFGPCRICEIKDINGDGEEEILAIASNNLLIFDSRLRLLGALTTDRRVNQVHFMTHPLFGGVISLIQGRLPGSRSALFLKLKPKTAMERTIRSISKYSVVLFALPFALGFMTGFLLLRVAPILWRRTRSATTQRMEERRDGLLEMLSAFGHGKTATSNLDRLSFLFRNLPPDQLPSSEYGRKLEESVETFFGFTSYRLSEIARRSRLAEMKRERIESLEGNQKRLEEILRNYKIQGVPQGEIRRLSRDIPTIVETIEEDIKSLKSELARYYSCNIISAVHEVLVALAPDMKKEEIDFKDLHIEGDLGAKGFISRSDFTTVFEELITNAIYSMRDMVKKEITVKIISSEEKILIEVADTGCGIKREDFRRIFDREYSTKKEGGFGLYHAKVILNKYGGKIRVVESEPGRGTRMRVELRRV